MPQGKGTYGSKVGRPPKKTNVDLDKGANMPVKKSGFGPSAAFGGSKNPELLKPKKSTVSAHGQLGDAQKEYETDMKLHKNKSLGKGGYVKKKQASPSKAGVGYTPFKMKAADYDNSPMKKNYGQFGVGHPEAPEKPTPNKFLGLAGGFFGSKNLKALRDKLKAKKEASAAAGAAPEDTSAEAAAENAEVAAGAATPDEAGKKLGGFAQIKKHMAGKEGGSNAEMEKRVSNIESLPQLQTQLRAKQSEGMGMMEKRRFDIANKKADRDAKWDKMFGRSGSQATSSMTMFSDVRLKEKIQKTGSSPSGIPIYEFNYIGDSNRYRGAMAQDLLDINPGAVEMDSSGYYKVNYNDIDVDMHQINN